MNVTSVSSLLPGKEPEQPSRQALGQALAVALWAVENTVGNDDTYELVYRLLAALSYRPGPQVRWVALLTYLAAHERWLEAGPNFDETELSEDDWQRMIRDELVAVAGRPA